VRLIIVLAALLLLIQPVAAQEPFAWPEGKRAAIALTYDDAMRSHLDVAVPQLDAANLRGTFFLDADQLGPDEMLRWREMQRAGHELGNHSLNHPCPRGMVPGAERYATEDYGIEAMLLEVAMMNSLLFGIDGSRQRTFAYPCSQALVGGIDYVDRLSSSSLVKYARTGGDAYNSVIADLTTLDLMRVPSWGPTDGPDARRLIDYAERVGEAGGLGVFQFHGVGGEYLSVSADAHGELMRYLSSRSDIWVAPLQEILDHVAQYQRAGAPAARD
jgi:peptidoglycan/xylan/chitin deacetylase (PgdA/CDA1 family)